MVPRNYSSMDGEDLLNIKKHKFTSKRITKNNCNNCNVENDKYSRYCKVCGNSLEETIKLENIHKRNFIGKEHIKVGLLSIIFLIIISFILKIYIASNYNEIENIISPLQIIMGLNLVPVGIKGSAIIASGTIKIKIGMVILIIAPIISIALSNIIIIKKKKSKSLLYNINSVAITYATLLVLISIFASSGTSIKYIIEYGLSLKLKYNIFRVFINGYIIAAFSTFISTYKKRDYKTNLYLFIIDKVIKTITIGYVLSIIIVIITSISDTSYLSEIGVYKYSKDLSLAMVISQFAIYMWSFGNFIPTTIANIEISPMSILSSNLFFETKLIFCSIIALSLLIILITGYKLREYYNKNNIKPIIIFATYYSIFMGVLSIFSKIQLDGNVSLLSYQNYEAGVIMGFSLISTVIRSFIYSFLVSLIGYKLNSEEKLEEDI